MHAIRDGGVERRRALVEEGVPEVGVGFYTGLRTSCWMIEASEEVGRRLEEKSSVRPGPKVRRGR